MIWGCQWDRTIEWIVETNGNNWSLAQDFRSWGNHKDSIGEASTNCGILQQTGYNEAWKKNNIYDIAGNAQEWTLETLIFGSNKIDTRIMRGYSYGTTGLSAAASQVQAGASWRVGSNPTTGSGDCGTRIVLYIN